MMLFLSVPIMIIAYGHRSNPVSWLWMALGLFMWSTAINFLMFVPPARWKGYVD